MNKKEQLSEAIATVERQISEAKSEVAKKTLSKKLERLKEELKAEKSSGESALKTLTKARKTVKALPKTDFEKLVEKLSEKPEYAFLKDYSKDRLRRDAVRIAKPKGYRFVGDNNAKPTIAQIKKGLKDGTVYYEGRPIRSDVNSKVRLEKGGEIEAPKFFKTGGQTYTWLNVTKMKSHIRFNNEKEAREAKKTLNDLNDGFTYHLVKEEDKFVIYREPSKDEFLLNIINTVANEAEWINVSSMKKEGTFESELEARKKFEKLWDEGSKIYYLLSDSGKNTFYVYSEAKKSDKVLKEIMAHGGHVSKGKMVWNQMLKEDKLKFMQENFGYKMTPEEIEGVYYKKYDFLPKNVKIVIESKLANVEEYAKGGGIEDYIIVSSYWSNKNDEIRSEKTFADYIKKNPIKNVWIGLKKIDNYKFDVNADKQRMIMTYALKKGASLKYYVSFLNHSVALKNNNAVFLEDKNYEDYDNKILTEETLELLNTRQYAQGGNIEFRSLAKSNNFDIIVPEGRFEVELDSNKKVKSIVHPSGERHQANECPIYQKYKKEIKEYLTERFENGGSVGNMWIALSKTKDGLVLSEEFDNHISNKELFDYYKNKGYEITDSNIFKVTNKNALDVFKDAVSKFIKEKYNETVDWENTLLSYKIVDDRIIAQSCSVETKSGNEYEVIPSDLVNKEFKDGGSVGSYSYLPNEKIEKIVLKSKQIIGKDRILDGAYIKEKLLKGSKSSKATKISKSAEEVYNDLIKYVKENFKEKKFGKDKDYYFTEAMIQQLIDAKYSELEIRGILFGINNMIEVDSDNELYDLAGIQSYGDDYKQKYIDWAVEASKKNAYELGLTYPQFDWKRIVAKYEINLKPIEIIRKREFSSGKYDNYVLICYVGKNIVIGGTSKRERYENGKLDEVIEERNPSEINGQFNGGYWGIVSSKKEVIKDVAEMLLSQKDGYVKDVDFITNNLGGLESKDLIKNNIKFATGGNISNESKNLSSMTGASAEAIENFFNQVGLDHTGRLKVTMGVGRGHLSRKDFATAIAGEKGNKYANEIIDYAQSDRAFKMAKGGNLGYAYVPNEDISKIIATDGTEYGENVILDGAYVTDKVRTPKMSRTQFEDDTYSFGNGGNLGKSLYVANSSFFDYNTYDTKLITAVLKAIGAKNIRLESESPNLPEVVVFNGDKSQAREALNSAFDTESILVYEKDWRKSKYEEGGNLGEMRFDLYGYKNLNDRVQEIDEIIHVDSYEEAEAQAKQKLEKHNLALVELGRKNEFVGSVRPNEEFIYSSRYKKEMAQGGNMDEFEDKIFWVMTEKDNDKNIVGYRVMRGDFMTRNSYKSKEEATEKAREMNAKAKYALGGEITPEEKEQALKNYPTLNF